MHNGEHVGGRPSGARAPCGADLLAGRVERPGHRARPDGALGLKDLFLWRQTGFQAQGPASPPVNELW